jgi:uncharacterized protein YlxW (UPF0749 family)
MLDKINCCVLALIAFVGNIVQLVFFFNYSLKLKDKSLQLEKQEIKNNDRIKELEKKNGKEQEQINQLKEEINKLKVKYEKNQ